MDSSGDFSFDSPPNLDFNPSVDAEMREEEDGIKRNEKERVSRQLNWIEISTRMLRIMKNALFHRLFGRNRPIETTGGNNETSTMDRFGKYRDL